MSSHTQASDVGIGGRGGHQKNPADDESIKPEPTHGGRPGEGEGQETNDNRSIQPESTGIEATVTILSEVERAQFAKYPEITLPIEPPY